MITLSPELQVSVTVSIGVACLAAGEAEGEPEQVARVLIAHADSLLYEAKENGRNRVISYSKAEQPS
jgi:diguanylate cyclase (GGDEF)-like protein